ncbi:MAG: NUDIX domain-containing protein [Rickettsiales bacterium]|nr:NUDIX domain-containing protein [Rickettsiales bacterium]
MERHFCVTVYTYNCESDRFIFVRHKKLRRWLPPGGHVEPNEIPDDAARREVFEETGIDDLRFVAPLDYGRDIAGLLTTPFGI